MASPNCLPPSIARRTRHNDFIQIDIFFHGDLNDPRLNGIVVHPTTTISVNRRTTPFLVHVAEQWLASLNNDEVRHVTGLLTFEYNGAVEPFWSDISTLGMVDGDNLHINIQQPPPPPPIYDIETIPYRTRSYLTIHVTFQGDRADERLHGVIIPQSSPLTIRSHNTMMEIASQWLATLLHPDIISIEGSFYYKHEGNNVGFWRTAADIQIQDGDTLLIILPPPTPPRNDDSASVDSETPNNCVDKHGYYIGGSSSEDSDQEQGDNQHPSSNSLSSSSAKSHTNKTNSNTAIPTIYGIGPHLLGLTLPSSTIPRSISLQPMVSVTFIRLSDVTGESSDDIITQHYISHSSLSPMRGCWCAITTLRSC